MNSRLLLNLALVIVVAVLGLIAWLQPGLDKPAAPPRLTDLDPAAINRIRIVDRDGPTIVLARKDGRWRIEEPIQLPANGFRIDSLLRLTGEASYGQLEVAEIDLAELGLDTPRIRLYLNDREFAFGTTEPIDGRRYVRTGDIVHLITDRYFHIMTAGPTDLVNQHLLPADSRITEITTPDWRLARAEDKWVLTPERPGLSADAANMVVDNWRQAQAVWIQPYEQSEAKGRIVVRLEGEEQPLQFDILAQEPELVLARPDAGVQYHLAEESARGLLEFREPAIEPEQENDEETVPPNLD